MKKRKIAVVTGSRAEYGLLYWTMKEIQADPELELQVIVTGMHLSPEFGNTYRFIEEDGFEITAKIEMLLSSDTASGIVKSMGLCMISATDILHKLQPDVMIMLGDRFESLAMAQAALMQRIPLAHIHGGELSAGSLDDATRHAITKMAHLHFVAADSYRNRVIQMGEHPDTVINAGAPALESISRMQLHPRNYFPDKMGLPLGAQNFLVTYHPASLALGETDFVLENLFASFEQFPDAMIIFTKANADQAGRFINKKIDEYVAKNPDRSRVFVSMGNLNYLSLLQHVDVVIGNSSSGIIEVPYFKKPTVNIGHRQANRLRASTIIDCSGKGDTIVDAIHQALSPEFQEKLNKPFLHYNRDDTASIIKNTVKQADLSKLIAKEFYDVSPV
jgi:UDP-hydrolysing UDP-N-acetyl-D-glucosamine 2-epimerase